MKHDRASHIGEFSKSAFKAARPATPRFETLPSFDIFLRSTEGIVIHMHRALKRAIDIGDRQ
jgi:hypothetical protein